MTGPGNDNVNDERFYERSDNPWFGSEEPEAWDAEVEIEQLREQVASLQLEEPAKPQGLRAAILEVQRENDRLSAALEDVADGRWGAIAARRIAQRALGREVT